MFIGLVLFEQSVDKATRDLLDALTQETWDSTLCPGLRPLTTPRDRGRGDSSGVSVGEAGD